MKMNRRLANYILLGVAVLFVLLAVINEFYSDELIFRLLLFMAEAALIGGIADWFAVTALYKRPIPLSWLPQPHTALIPNNRDKVIQAVAKAVEEELLTKELLKNKAAQIDIVGNLIKIADDKNQAQPLSIFLVKFVQKIIARLNPAEIAAYLEKLLKSYAKDLDLAPLLRDFIQKATEGREDDKWIELALEKLLEIASEAKTKDKIYALLKEKEEEETTGGPINWLKGLVIKGAELVDAYSTEELADNLHQELINTIQEMKDPRHIIRIKIREAIREAIKELDSNKAWQEKIQAWKNGLMERLDLREILQTLVRAAIKIATASTSEIGGGFFKKAETVLDTKQQVSLDHESLLLKWAVSEFEKYWAYFKTNSSIKGWLEKYIKKIIDHIIEKEHPLVGQIVKETLSAFTNEKLINFIDEKFGSDLQWIRINGCIVGSIVGLAIFAFLEWLYTPLLLLLGGQA